MTWNIKFDDFTVLQVISTIQYGINFIVSPLQPWYFDTKITSEKNSYLDEGWLFIGRFNVRSVPGIINKEVSAQFIYKP